MKQLTDHIELKNEFLAVTEDNFESFALRLFRFQYDQNEFYRQYCNVIKAIPSNIQSLEMIPFLPIQFFKSKKITSSEFVPEVIFESSGTTGNESSKHFVKDTDLYEKSFLRAFELFYGNIKDYCIIGLLPSYLERKNSSLIWMVNEFIKKSGHPYSGFYLNEFQKLKEVILKNEKAAQRTILIGVTYALLDFFEMNKIPLKYTIVMETGGMKGKRDELTRATVQQHIIDHTGLTEVHSEYGMTELLSQAYSKKDGLFHCPPWMKVLLRSEDDPFEIHLPGKINGVSANAVINVIDLANIFSCAFIATDDMGKLYNNGSFEVLGRQDNSDVRGCSLLTI